MKQELAELFLLSPGELHREAWVRSRRLHGAEWDMMVCLLAVEQTKAYKKRDCSSTMQYAIVALQLDPHKAGELLRAARSLEQLPVLAAAFREGKVGWSKLREITRVAVPDTDAQWTEVALTRTAAEIQRAVAQTPTQRKQEQRAEQKRDEVHQPELLPPDPQQEAAGAASLLQAAPPHLPLLDLQPNAARHLDPQPGVEQQQLDPQPEVERHLNAKTSTDGQMAAQVAQASSQLGCIAPVSAIQTAAPLSTSSSNGSQQSTSAPQFPPCPKLVRVNLAFTAEEYAIVDQALAKARGKKRKNVRREEAIVEMAKQYLANGDSRSQQRYRVIIHFQPQTGEAWHETDRGVLAADPAVVASALAHGEMTVVTDTSAPVKPTGDNSPIPSGHAPVPEVPEASDPSRSSARASAEQPSIEQHASAEKPCADEQSVLSGQFLSAEQLTLDAAPSTGKAPARKRNRRPAIPSAVISAVVARANGQCEEPGCGSRAVLHFHHKKPWSQVREHTADNIVLRCSRCHAYKHEEDFETNQAWKAARSDAVGTRADRGSVQDRVGFDCS